MTQVGGISDRSTKDSVQDVGNLIGSKTTVICIEHLGSELRELSFVLSGKGLRRRL